MKKSIIALTVLLSASNVAFAVDVPDTIKADIKSRCSASMAEYGDSMIYSCAKLDIKGYIAAMEYKKSYPDIVARCEDTMDGYGWSMISSCAKLDIEARNKLSDL